MVASIDYRLAPENPWPDQIIDVKCAVRYLRAHAADLGIDPNRIAALGTSAGGQLVSLLGTTGSSTLWDAGPYPDESSAVDAVVDEFGPADLEATGLAAGLGRHDPPGLRRRAGHPEPGPDASQPARRTSPRATRRS